MSGMIPGMEVYCVVTYGGHGMRDCNPRERAPGVMPLSPQPAQEKHRISEALPCSFLCSCRMYRRAREHAHAPSTRTAASPPSNLSITGIHGMKISPPPAGREKIPALHAPRVLLSAHAFNPGRALRLGLERISPVDRLLKHTTLLRGRRGEKNREVTPIFRSPRRECKCIVR